MAIDLYKNLADPARSSGSSSRSGLDHLTKSGSEWISD